MSSYLVNEDTHVVVEDGWTRFREDGDADYFLEIKGELDEATASLVDAAHRDGFRKGIRTGRAEARSAMRDALGISDDMTLIGD